MVVREANGDILSSQGKCSKLPIKLQDQVFPVDFLLLPLVGCDIVMGVKLLKELGPLVFDFQKLTMIVEWKGKKVTLQGIRQNKTEIESIEFREGLYKVQNDT